jgi:hypothetical protein
LKRILLIFLALLWGILVHIAASKLWVAIYVAPILLGVLVVNTRGNVNALILRWLCASALALEVGFLFRQLQGFSIGGKILTATPPLLAIVLLLWEEIWGDTQPTLGSWRDWFRKTVLGGAALMIVFFVLAGALNYSGFCFKEMRYLSDEEKIRKAISANYTIKGNDSYWYSWESPRSASDRVEIYRKIIPYDDVDAFLRENPNCCTVIYKGFADDPAPSFWQRVTGHFNYGVRMKYTEKYIEKHLKEPIEPNVKGWEQKRDHALEKAAGQEGKRFIIKVIFLAGNCEKFCCVD